MPKALPLFLLLLGAVTTLAAEAGWNRGVVEPAEEPVRIASPLPGVVLQVPVRVGTKVAIGELLLQVDDRDTKAVVEAQTAMLAVQEAKLKAAEVLLADRADQLRRVEQLRRDNSSSESELQRARFAAQGAETAVLQARAEVDSTRAQLARARVQLEMLSVRAPRAGTVLQVNVRPGESATPRVTGEPLILLGDLEKLRLRVSVDEAGLAKLKPGHPAKAFAKGQRNQPLDLKFERLEPQLAPRNGPIEERPAQAIFSFENGSEGKVRTGQVLEVEY